MFLFLVAFLIFQLFYLATATPVGPPGQNADGTILLPNPADGNLSSVHTPLILPNNTADNDPDPTTTLGAGHVGRPRMAKIYPQLAVGKYHIRFHNYGQDIDRQEGASVLARAAHEVQDWIAHTRKQSYTPVESEHTWRSENVELSIRPRQDGYTLGDLKCYIALMIAFHGKYDSFWEWDAQLIVAPAFHVTGAGTANLRIVE